MTHIPDERRDSSEAQRPAESRERRREEQRLWDAFPPHAQEALRLAQKYRTLNAEPDLIERRNDLAGFYLPDAARLASWMRTTRPWLGTREEVESRVYEVLLDALPRFDRTRGSSFTTFLRSEVKESLRRPELKEAVSITDYAREQMARVERTREALQQELDRAREALQRTGERSPTGAEIETWRTPTDTEIAVATGMSVMQVRIWLNTLEAIRPAPGASPDAEAAGPLEQAKDDTRPTPEEEVLQSEYARWIWTVAAQVLNEQDLAILRLRFLQGITPVEVAQNLAITREAERQRYGRALKKVRRAIEEQEQTEISFPVPQQPMNRKAAR